MPLESSDSTSLTQALPESVISAAISGVVARARSDRDYVLDMVTVLQIKARMAEDTGERLSFAEFADRVGFDLAQLRAE